jgi:hypothetical protein
VVEDVLSGHNAYPPTSVGDIESVDADARRHAQAAVDQYRV